MNPLLQEALTSILRKLLASAATFLVVNGYWTSASAATYVEAAALFLVSVGWGVWSHYGARLRQVIAQESPSGTTDTTINRVISNNSLATNLTIATMPKS